MSRTDPVIIDQWSYLSHKEPVGNPGDTQRSMLRLAPSWVPDDHARRLDAYKVLAAYRSNVAREMLPSYVSDDERRDHREYGDPTTLSNRMVAAILGSNWSLVIDGADDELAAGPRLPDRPDVPDGFDQKATPTTIDERIAKARLDAWDAEVADIVDDWELALVVQPDLRRRQEALRAWAEEVQFAARVDEAEHDAWDLGDGVYVLWPRAGDWPTIEVYDPGFYFPDLATMERGEFPGIVHLAWEEGEGTEVHSVRRMTWQLVDLTIERMVFDAKGQAVFTDGDGQALAPGQQPGDLPAGDRIVRGQIQRTLPWHADGEFTTTTCVFSDGSWLMSNVQGAKSDALDPSKAVWRSHRLDLGVDFIPVIHDPNTATGKLHFGTAGIAHVAQVLDDLSQTDTSIMGAVPYLAGPALGLENAAIPNGATVPPVLMPKTIMTGKITAIDLAGGFKELTGHGDRLGDRLLANLGIPAEMLGRVNSDTAGVAHLALKYAPLDQVVTACRLPRRQKYMLLPKFAQRLAQVARKLGPDGRATGEPVLPPGPTPVARLNFGPFLPSNQAGVIEMAAAAVTAHIMSIETAIGLLVDAGIPVADAALELRRILAQDTQAANFVAEALAGATGATEVVAERLDVADKVKTSAPPIGPKINLPPGGAGS